MKSFLRILAFFSAGLFASSCDQSTVHFPEDSSSCGECGSWYPGGSGRDGGEGFSIEKDATFPCLVWESVRQNKEDTWLNIGDVYLGAKHGETSAKALVIVKVGISCAGCHELIIALAEVRERLELNAVMVALTHGDVLYPEIFPLDEAQAVIVDKEGWPEGWYLTNDAENHFSESQFVGIPWVTVVDLQDMRVVSSSNSTFSAANVEELMALVESL